MKTENSTEQQSAAFFQEMQLAVFKRTDHMFAGLMIAQWIFGIICALVVSPRAWEGEVSHIHIHVWAAIFLGGILTALPVTMAWLQPGWVFTRHLIAFTQMLWSALLIHLTGGRIETHFHVFGSLAFLAFYRDWPVLITATVVVAADHFLRGWYWPQSVYGVVAASPWRWLEHTGWVVFEDVFLIAVCIKSKHEMQEICARRARLENVNKETERLIWERTAELEQANQLTEIQAKRLVRSNGELQQFAYVASHDLQEPLRMISSYLQLISKRYQGKLDKDADEYIGFAVDGAVRLKRLINDLLDYSRIDTQGKQHIETNSEEVLKRALSNLKMAIEESGTVVTYDPLPPIIADDGQLERLFQNLVGNGIKYRKKDVSQKIHISAKESNGDWVFSVRDNGIGIAKEHFNRIFTIFQRLHTSGVYPGTGIGLSVCRKIVENHGGHIWVESEPGTGSTFYFSVPKKMPKGNST